MSKSITVIDFDLDHLDEIEVQESQLGSLALLDEKFLDYMESDGDAITFIDKDGRILSIVGFYAINNIGFTWALNSKYFPEYALPITRTTKKMPIGS